MSKYYAEYFYKTNILQSPSSGHTSSWWTVPESITPKFKQDIISMSRIIQNSSTNVISTCYTEAKLNSINILTNYNFVLPKLLTGSRM